MNEQLFEAILHGDVARASRLVAGGACANDLSQDGRSVWSFAVAGGPGSVKLALECGADPNLIDGVGRPALYWSIPGNDDESASLLIEAGAKLDFVHQADSFNLLHEAAFSGADAVLGVFVKHAPCHLFAARNVFGRTPREEAVEAGNPECASLLAGH